MTFHPFLQPGFSATLFALLLAVPAVAQPQRPIPSAAVPAGLEPGQRLRATLRVPPDSAITAERNRTIEGLLTQIDSTAVTLRLDDRFERQIARDDVEGLQAWQGRSHWYGLLAGWLASAPVALVACRNAQYECEQGSLIGLVGGISGAVIGWPRWKDAPWPAPSPSLGPDRPASLH